MPLRSFTSAEMMLTRRRRLESPLLVLIWMSTAGFALAGLGVTDGSVFYVVAASVAVGINMMAVHARKEVYVRRFFVNLAGILAALLLVIELSASLRIGEADGMSVIPVAHFLILIQLCKLFERKTNRDYVQMIAMSILVMLGATIITEALWFAVWLVLYAGLACYTAMIFTLKRGIDAAAGARLTTESGPLPARHVAWNVIRDWPGLALRRRGILAMCVIIAIAAAVFLLMPRSLSHSRSMMAQMAKMRALTGYSQSIRLDRPRKIGTSNRVVMHVRWTRPDGEPYWPSATYLRGKTFAGYADSHWSRWLTGPDDVEPREPNSTPAAGPSGQLVQHTTMAGSLAPTVFALHPAAPVVDGWQIGADGGMTLTDAKPVDRVLYDVHLWRRPLSGEQLRYLAERHQPYLRQLATSTGRMDISPRVAALARQWCGQLLSQRERQPHLRDEIDMKIARRIAEMVSRRCQYTLDLSDADNDTDGVEDFLFNMKRGHCEYFASAVTVMCRSLWVRARVATGFLVDSRSRSGQTYVVRDRNAHAWTEVYTASGDWQVVDASPRASLPVAVGGVWASVSRFWEDMRFTWYDKVVGYDSSDRARLARWLKQRAAALKNSLERSFIDLFAHGHVDRTLVQLSVIVGLVGMVLEGMLVFRWIGRTRRRRQMVGLVSASPAQLRFARRLMELLRRCDGQVEGNRTPREVATAAPGRFDLPADVLVGLVDLYYRLRWGHAPVGDGEIRSAEGRVEQLQSML